MLNYLLSIFWQTRSRDLIFGLLAFLVIMAASSWFKLPILHQILVLVSNVAMIGIIVIFQPELRAALSRLTLKGKHHKEFSEFDRFLDQLATSVYRLSEKRIGALIVLQHDDPLDEYAAKAIRLNAQFTPELLESIFMTSAPLHDGAVLIHEQTILAASAILPLAEEDSQLTRSMGTRHRAALGFSQQNDGLVIVVSEETGKVSIARQGVMTRGIKVDRFKGIIRSLYNPTQEKPVRGRFKIREWLRQ